MTTKTTTDRSPDMTAFLRWLRAHDACSEGVALVRQHPTPEAWWAASERGDHMLWLCGRAGIRRQEVVLAACACARLALPHVTPGETRPLRAIETAERWARGETGVTIADLRDAAAAAYDDATAAYAAYAAAYAAAADAYATTTTTTTAAYAAAATTATTATTAAYAAYAAYAATAAADAYAAARTRILRQCADIVRERIPWSMVAAAMETKP